MKIYESLVGFIVVDESNEIVHVEPFPRDGDVIADKLFTFSRYSETEELKLILDKFSDEVFYSNSSHVVNYLRQNGRKCELNLISEEHKVFFENFLSNLLKREILKNEQEYFLLNREVNIALSKKGVAQSSQRVDKMIVHAILSMDDIDKTINLFVSRVREWYGVHFPEIIKIVENHHTLCQIITDIGARQDFTSKKLASYGFIDKKQQQLVEQATKSMGAHFNTQDLEPLQKMAQQIISLYAEREYLENWIETQLDHIAPNMKAVVGGIITARIIALAGGLQELALRPSSTVQLLGAEKALFRALKTGAKPPKHGVIYQMPELNNCSWWQKGNISRAIAGKLTIAARIDAFQGEFAGTELRLDLERKIAEIKEKYTEAPEGKTEPVQYDFSQQKRPEKRFSQRPRQDRDKRQGKGKPMRGGKPKPKGGFSNKPRDKRKR